MPATLLVPAAPGPDQAPGRRLVSRLALVAHGLNSDEIAEQLAT